jgi:hypothetical protein
MSVNPYICQKPFNYYKLVLFSPLAVLRLLLITFILLIFYCIILIDTRKKYNVNAVSCTARTLVFLCGFYYVKTSMLINKPNIRVVYNHTSILDSLFVLGYVGFFRPVIYEGYYDLIKPLADYCDAVTVNTDSNNNLIKIIGKSVFIAPE